MRHDSDNMGAASPEPADAGPPCPAVTPAGRVRRVAGRVVVIVALGWALAHRPGLGEVREHPGRAGLFVAAIVAANMLWLLGLGLAVSAIGRHMRRPETESPWRTLRRRASLRNWTDEMLLSVDGDPRFRAGFAINWVGAVIAAVVPALAVLTLLPRSAWSIVAISFLDLASTIALRWALRARMRRLTEGVDD